MLLLHVASRYVGCPAETGNLHAFHYRPPDNVYVCNSLHACICKCMYMYIHVQHAWKAIQKATLVVTRKHVNLITGHIKPYQVHCRPGHATPDTHASKVYHMTSTWSGIGQSSTCSDRHVLATIMYMYIWLRPLTIPLPTDPGAKSSVSPQS